MRQAAHLLCVNTRRKAGGVKCDLNRKKRKISRALIGRIASARRDVDRRRIQITRNLPEITAAQSPISTPMNWIYRKITKSRRMSFALHATVSSSVPLHRITRSSIAIADYATTSWWCRNLYSVRYLFVSYSSEKLSIMWTIVRTIRFRSVNNTSKVSKCAASHS